MSGRLAGKVAIVTGSSSGIGQSIAVRLATEGANVVINYRNRPEGANDTVTVTDAPGTKLTGAPLKPAENSPASPPDTDTPDTAIAGSVESKRTS